MNNENRHSQLLKSLIVELWRGRDLLTGIDKAAYAGNGVANGSIGGHMRHNCDFVRCFLVGLESGKINYNDRGRDLRIENDPDYAASQIERLVDGIKAIEGVPMDVSVEVASEMIDGGWHSSSFSRELEFVHSHTIHHYALVAQKLERLGIKTDREFGVAPSTLKYWEAKAGRK